jgi:alkylation response protein AidB-like acyl-CoA dehydrogenase
MRIHGSYGYSTELDIERLYRDAPLMAIGEGTNDILRTVIAKRLLARASKQGPLGRGTLGPEAEYGQGH